MNKFMKFKGFTLIELIVVIGIIAILAAIVIIAVNPARQFAQARNTQRNSDVLQILNAVYQYASDNNGSVPSTITPSEGAICNSGTNAANAGGTCTGVDLRVLVPTYLSAIPKDPSSAGAAMGSTNYYIVKGDTNNGVPLDRIQVRAAGAELAQTIKVTR